jgi:rhodanese-related sulfurtransferase
MNSSARKTFNENFSDEKYADFLVDLNAGLKNPVEFRIAETPVFLTDDFRDKLLQAGEEIIDTILKPGFKEKSERAIPEKWRVANETGHSHFIALDFGVCKDEAGNIVPKLIEMQGFPSLYGFQVHLAENYRHAFNIPGNQTIFFNGLSKSSYLDLLRKTIIGPYQPDEVVLMDVDAPNQKTAVDFFITEGYIGIPVISLADLIQKGDQLFYKTTAGEKKRIRRIYNRLIFDEIESDPDIFKKVVDIRQPFDVEWVTHPNWFYRISKFTMPFLKGDHIPKTQFLHEVSEIPEDLQNYVLKPLFSFAGQGVIIDIMDGDIEKIKDPENWILQEKVTYEPVLQSPDGGVKIEIRLLYLWPDGDAKPTLAVNLSRLSRGKMIGVRYNKDFDWVGGTIAFMHK